MASRIDALIEQLVFGTKSAPTGPVLGLYLGPDVVYLSETRLSGGKVAVDHLVRIPLPSADGKSPTGTMSSEFLADPAKVAAAIRQSMSQMRWNAKSVRVTLSHHLGLLRYFTMPMLERRFLRSAVPIEAKKYIPIPFDLLAHDFEAVAIPPDAAGKPRLGVLMAVTQRKNIANVEKLLEALGLTLEGIEVAPLSVLRLWRAVEPPSGPEPYVHVHLDGGAVRVMICEQNMPIFFREVFLPSDAALDDLRKIDLPGCLSFVSKQLGVANVRSIRVSGAGAAVEGIRAAFAQETGLPATMQDTPQLLSIKSGDWGGYASLGASAKTAGGGPPLNLASVERVTEDEARTARDILLAGAALAVFLTAVGLFKSVLYGYRARELHAFQIAPEVEAALAGLPASSIQERLQEMQTQLDKLASLSPADRPKVSTAIKHVIEAMPESIWLSHMSVTNPLMNAERAPYEMTLRGHAQDRSVSEEQALVFQFKEALLNSPLAKDFDVQVSVSKQGGADENLVGLDPKQLAARLAERTVFTLSVRSKK